ncbi:uncharacterized protein LOC144114685 [Amblyomma americanum]
MLTTPASELCISSSLHFGSSGGSVDTSPNLWLFLQQGRRPQGRAAATTDSGRCISSTPLDAKARALNRYPGSETTFQRRCQGGEGVWPAALGGTARDRRHCEKAEHTPSVLCSSWPEPSYTTSSRFISSCTPTASVARDSCSLAAAATISALRLHSQQHAAFLGSSTTAELMGIRLGLDLLLTLGPPPPRSALLCDSPRRPQPPAI